jgi:predicted Rossmann fold nucleotide-binding protein DprA/Smf involved in DNA uptake
VVYPKEHGKLKEEIRRNGVIITEFAPSTEPKGSNFPIRNRIISGLSGATVVVDADLGSGAMITAKNAILQGRDIYAVPSNIDAENSSGTNSLIRDGAQAVLCGNDIVKHYLSAYKKRLNVKRLHDAEEHSALDESALRAFGVRIAGEKADKVQKRIADREKSRSERAYSKDTEAQTPKDPSAYERAILGSSRPEPQNVGGDKSQAALDSLTEKQRRVFDEIPLDFPVTVDNLTKTGLKLGEVIAALTVLEVKGLVVSLPGAIYMRK